MKLRELIACIGEDVNIYIDGKLYKTILPTEMFDERVTRIDVKTDTLKNGLEDLSYSFEVGV